MSNFLAELRQNLLNADRDRIMSECIDEKLDKSVNYYYEQLVRRYDYILSRSAVRVLNNILKEQEKRDKEAKRLARLANKQKKETDINEIN